MHLPVAFLPYTTGGREVYTYGLATALQNNGVENYIVIHQDPSGREPLGTYTYDGLSVTVLPPLPNFNHPLARYKKEYETLPGFEEVLDKIQPDIVHFHDQGGGASLSHLKVVKNNGYKTILTYHTPGQSCTQSELRFKGVTVCDGRIDLHRCTACRLSAVSNLSYTLASAIAAVPINSEALALQSSKIAKLFSARTKTNLFIDNFNQFIQLVDMIHVHAKWVHDMLLLNKIDSHKIFFAATASISQPQKPIFKHYGEQDVLKLVFIGRCTFVKGIHILIAAVQKLPSNIRIEVQFWGPYWDDDFGKQMTAQIENDRRFCKPELVPNHLIKEKLSEIDMVVVPSIWLETGPLSLFDALSAGVPVIGSRLGGIAEWIQDGKNGLLFEPESSDSLAQVLEKVALDKTIINDLKKGLGYIRTMQDLGNDLEKVYERLHG